MEPFTTAFLIWLVFVGSLSIKYNLFTSDDVLDDTIMEDVSTELPKYEDIDNNNDNDNENNNANDNANININNDNNNNSNQSSPPEYSN